MRQIIGETESLCPECFVRIPATKVEQDGNIYLEKSCPQHGNYQVIIWRGDAKSYADWERFAGDGYPPEKMLKLVEMGCPYDCGLCPSHKVNACTMVMEVTHRCDLKCPVCFATAGDSLSCEPDINAVREMYQVVLDTVGPCTIQLSGGEPTLRDDLPQIISLGRKMGFDHILLNTNGLRLSRDTEYLRSLRDSGLSAVYLQFDGMTDDVYRFIRGADLLERKLRIVDKCAQEKVGVILVPVLVPSVNMHHVGDIFYFAKNHIPVVKGVHFQPISYLGRYPTMPSGKDRITMPDVVDALVQQTNGVIKRESLLPRNVKDSHCSFSGLFVLAENGQLLSLSNPDNQSTICEEARKQSPENSSRDFMSLHWRFYDESREAKSGSCCGCSTTDYKHESDSSIYIFDRILTHSLTISCMPFQDVWNIDLDRLKGCCGHVVTQSREIIPFCAFYLTNANGERLYGRRKSWKHVM